MKLAPLDPLPAGESTNAFRTHANYIEAFYHLLDCRWEASSRETLSIHVYNRIKESSVCAGELRTGIDEDALRRSLTHAWGIELLLYANQQAIEDDPVIRLANNWACIQAYYVFYHATQALWMAKGHPRPESHSATQKTFVNLWSGRAVELAPWSLVAGSNGVIGLPAGRTATLDVSNLAKFAPGNAWGLVAQALRTTREKVLPEAIRKRREDKRRAEKKSWEAEEQTRRAEGRRARSKCKFPHPRLSAVEKDDVKRSLRAYSMMDYLYRLRIKANYEDADMFTEGPTDAKQSAVFYRQLCALASATLFLTELAVMPLWGRAKFLAYREGWMKSRSDKVTQQELLNRSSLLNRHPV